MDNVYNYHLTLPEEFRQCNRVNNQSIHSIHSSLPSPFIHSPTSFVCICLYISFLSFLLISIRLPHWKGPWNVEDQRIGPRSLDLPLPPPIAVTHDISPREDYHVVVFFRSNPHLPLLLLLPLLLAYICPEFSASITRQSTSEVQSCRCLPGFVPGSTPALNFTCLLDVQVDQGAQSCSLIKPCFTAPSPNTITCDVSGCDLRK